MGAPPHAPGDFLAGLVVPAPTCRRSARAWLCHARHPGDFLPDEKVTKESPRGVTPLGTPLGGHYHPPSGDKRRSPRKGCNSGQYVRNKTPAVPRIDSRECFPDGTEGKNKTDLPSNLKWQIGLFLWLRVDRVQAKRSTNEGGKFAPGDSKGRSPWRAFGDFPRVGKVTRGGGAERPPHRGAQRGLRPLASSGPGSEGRSALLIGNRDCRPAKTPG